MDTIVEDVEEDQFQLELCLRDARRFVLNDTAGLALVRTSDIGHLVRLFSRSKYNPSFTTQPRTTSGRKSVYRELSNKDLVDHAFWMASRFFPDNLEGVRLYVMVSLRIYFRHFAPSVQPKALEALIESKQQPNPAPPVAAADFSDDDADAVIVASPPAAVECKTTTAATAPVFSLAPDGAWVLIRRASGGRQHKKERGVPSLTMRQPGYYDLVSLPLEWPADVELEHVHDNDAMALLALTATTHGALRFRPKQVMEQEAARFVYERAAWPVFVGRGGKLYMPTDAVVTAAEKVRQLRFTQHGLSTKEVAAYWPTDASSLSDFNEAERPDGSRLWLVSAQTLCRNQRLSTRSPTLPKGVPGAAELASDGSDPLYRRFPAWYTPYIDRIEIFKSYIIQSSPELIRDLARERTDANGIVIQTQYA